MHLEWKLKFRSPNTSYCLIEVVTKAGLTVHRNRNVWYCVIKQNWVAQ